MKLLNINTLDDLIGLKFKRNVYGLTNWTEIIKQAGISTVIDSTTNTAKLTVLVSHRESPPFRWYNLDEIVIVNE